MYIHKDANTHTHTQNSNTMVAKPSVVMPLVANRNYIFFVIDCDNN